MKLDLVWAAKLENVEGINQFDDVDHQETGEHRFQEVLDRSDELIQFALLNLKTQRVYAVDLLRGRIHMYKNRTYTSPAESEVYGDRKYKYRLIYFRRVTQQMTWDGKAVSDKGITDIQYFLGFQYTNEKGENVKRLLQISKDDEVHIA